MTMAGLEKLLSWLPLNQAGLTRWKKVGWFFFSDFCLGDLFLLTALPLLSLCWFASNMNSSVVSKPSHQKFAEKKCLSYIKFMIIICLLYLLL